MNEEAINYSYDLFKKDGYSGSIDQYKELIKSNKEAFDYSYSLFKNDGYSGTIDDFSTLMGNSVEQVVEQKVEQPKKKDFGFFANSPASLAAIEMQTGKQTPKLQELAKQTFQSDSEKQSKFARQLSRVGIDVDTIGDYLEIANNRFYNFPADVLDTYSVVTSFIGDKLTGEQTKATDMWSSKIADEWRGIVNEMAPLNKEVKESFSGQVVDGLAQVLPLMLTGGGSRATNVVKAFTANGTKLTPYVETGKEIVSRFGSPQGIIAGSQIAAPSYRQALQEGATEEEARKFAIENFFVGSVMESLPIQSMFSRLSKIEPNARILDILKEGGIGFGQEAITEMMQETYANMSANRIYEANKSMLDGVGEAGAVGGSVGFLLNSMMAALTGRRARVSVEEQPVIDKAIEETKAKIETVESNNRQLKDSVEAIEAVEVNTLSDGKNSLDFVRNKDGNWEYANEGLTEKTANEAVEGLSELYPNMQFTAVNNTGSDPLASANFTIVGSPKKPSVYKIGGKGTLRNAVDLAIQSAESIDELERISIENDPELESALRDKVNLLTEKTEEPKNEPESVAEQPAVEEPRAEELPIAEDVREEPISEGTDTEVSVESLSFSSIPVFVQSREEGKKVEKQVFDILEKTELGQVLSNGDGEIRIITEKSIDKKGNIIIGVTSFERNDDGSLTQIGDTVFVSKNTEGKVKSDYNPHTVARDFEGNQVVTTDQITNQFIDLSSEKVLTTDENGNLVETKAFSRKKINQPSNKSENKPTISREQTEPATQEEIDATAKALEGVDVKNIISPRKEGNQIIGFESGTKVYRAGGVGRYFTTDKQYIQEGGFKEEIREFEIPKNSNLLDLRDDDFKGILDLATNEEKDVLRKPTAKYSKESKEQGDIVDSILRRNGYDGYIIKDAGDTKDYDTVVFRKDRSPDYTTQSISKAYHKAKAKPESTRTEQEQELVKAVEDLLGKKEPVKKEQPTDVKPEPERIAETDVQGPAKTEGDSKESGEGDKGVEEKVTFTVFGEQKTGRIEGDRIIGDDGTKYTKSMVKEVAPIEAQKKKVKELLADLKSQIKEDKSGIMFDFRARAEADIKFYNTLKNLTVEYARLKGMQFSDFVKTLQETLGKELGKKNIDYVRSLWDEAKEEKPLSVKEQIKASTESKPTRERNTIVNDYTELKRSLRERAKASRLGAKTEKQRVAEIRKILADFIKVNAKEINGIGVKLSTSILRRINNIGSDLSLQNTLDYIDKILKDQNFANSIAEKESLINKIKEQADPKKQVKRESGIVKSKRRQTAEGISVLKKITDALGMTRVEGETRIQEIQVELQNPDITKEQRFDLEAEMYAMNFSGLESLSNSQIQQLLDELILIKKTDKIDALATVKEFRDRIETNIQETLKVLNPENKKVLPVHLAKKSDFRNRSLVRNFFLMNDSWIWVMDKLSRLEKSTGSLKSFLNEKFDRELVANKNLREQVDRAKYFKQMQDKFAEIFEADTPKKREKIVTENTIPKPFSYIDINGNKVDRELSQNEIYKRWMELQDETLIPTFEKMGIGQNYVDAIEKAIDPKVKKWAEWQLNEFYPKYAKTVNEVYRRVYGIDMPIRDNYSPISRVQNKTDESEHTTFASSHMVNSVNNGSLKARVGSTLPLRDMDGDQVLIRHIYDMEFFKHHAESLKELSSTLLDNRVANTINQIHGEEYMKAINFHIKTFYRKGEVLNEVDKLAKKFRSTFTVSTLAVNPVTMIKQLTSIPAYANFIPITDWVKGTASFFKNPIENAKFLYDNSDFLKMRYEQGFERDMILAMTKDWKNIATGKDNFSSKVMFMTKWGDAAAIFTGGYAVYDYHYKQAIKNGMTPSEAKALAINEFEKATEFAQQAGDTQNLNQFMKSSEFYKFMTMYKTSPIAYHSMAMGALRNLIQGKGNTSDNAKQFLLFHVVLPVIFQWASAGFRVPEDDPDFWFEMARAALFGNINSIFIAGDFAEYLWKNAIEGKPFDYNMNPIIEGLYQGSKKTFAKFVKAFETMTFEDFIMAFDQLTRTSSMAIPAISWYNQGSRVTEGVIDVIQGKTEHPLQRAVGWSDWALGENPNQNKQKNLILRKMLGEDYNTKKNIDGDNYIDINEKNSRKNPYKWE